MLPLELVIVVSVVAWVVVVVAFGVAAVVVLVLDLVVDEVLLDEGAVVALAPPVPVTGVPVAVIAEEDWLMDTAPLYSVGPGTT